MIYLLNGIIIDFNPWFADKFEFSSSIRFTKICVIQKI